MCGMYLCAECTLSYVWQVCWPLHTAASEARIEGKTGEIGVFGLLAVEKAGETFIESIL